MQIPKLPNLYVALKCDTTLNQQVYNLPTVAKSSNCIKILIRPPTVDNDDDQSIYNVVYNKIIQKTFP